MPLPDSSKNKKLPSLDGWRAVSISLLLLGHSVFTPGFPSFAKGFNSQGTGILGVRFFFVISGFLITWLLVGEREKTGSINLKHFYARRVLRIFPVNYVYLAVLGLLTAYRQPASAWLANFTYTTNFFPTGFPTSHLWSLAVEEQFYLLWPFLLCLLPPAEKRILLALAVPVVVAPLVRSLSVQSWLPPGFPHLFGYWSFFSQFVLLAYGCLAALLFAHHRPRLESFYRRHPVLIPAAAAALIAASAALHSRIAGLYESLQGSGFAVLLLQSVLYPANFFFRPLNWRWVRHLGVLSYSIYIWQMMFCGTDETVFGLKGAWWVTFPAWIAVSILAAHASYYLLEKPLFRLREKFRPRPTP